MEFSIGEHRLRFSGIDPETEGLILKRFLPVVGDLVPWFVKGMNLVGEITPENKDAKLGEMAEMVSEFQSAGGDQMIGAAMTAIGRMQDEDMIYVLRTVLRHVSYDNGQVDKDGNAIWKKITLPDGTTFQFEQFKSLPARLMIVGRVIGGRSIDFFTESALILGISTSSASSALFPSLTGTQ